VAPASELQGRVDRYFDSAAGYWRTIYEDTTAYAVIHQERQARALEWVSQLELEPDAPVLEIGSGAGLTSVALAERGLRVTATDTVPAMIRLTDELVAARSLGDRVRTSRVDAHSLPFADGTYAVALALGVLPWLHDPGQALREMARVIRPGGFLLVNVDNVFRLHYLLDPMLNPALTPMRQLARRALQVVGIVGAADGTLSHLDAPARFDAELAGLGLAKLKGETIGFGPFTFLHRRMFDERTAIRLHVALQRFADRPTGVIRSLGAQYLVLARKEVAAQGVSGGASEAIADDANPPA
jgi:ubiquinone/menaquinone biosynthesis C-methylase UbiE